ncbi:hypothetical protein V7S43_012945 [Phytophthora oleae]|uniref:Ankyrin repeat protein n=1 Tax=Phytophthora oleae TaxID=2107226 RepID=A0ABD3F779_9STRA
MHDVLRSAVKGENLDIIRWLCNEYGLHASGMLRYAIDHYQWETARWIIEKYDISRQPQNWYFPARDGKLSFLKYLASRNIGSVDRDVIPVAAANGYLDVIEWLHGHRGHG